MSTHLSRWFSVPRQAYSPAPSIAPGCLSACCIALGWQPSAPRSARPVLLDLQAPGFEHVVVRGASFQFFTGVVASVPAIQAWLRREIYPRPTLALLGPGMREVQEMPVVGAAYDILYWEDWQEAAIPPGLVVIAGPLWRAPMEWWWNAMCKAHLLVYEHETDTRYSPLYPELRVVISPALDGNALSVVYPGGAELFYTDTLTGIPLNLPERSGYPALG